MASEESSPPKICLNNNIEWNVHNEVKLLLALMGHKPVGVAKHFHMACVLSKFSESVKRDDISSQVIWDRLDTMYDLKALEESENNQIPFPTEIQDFSLPQPQYGALLAQKKSVRMPPPPAPSPPLDSRKDDSREVEKEFIKDSSNRKDSKDSAKRAEEKKGHIRDSRKDSQEEIKKVKRLSKEPFEVKKEKDSSKVKEVASKESRLPKRTSIVRDDEDSSVSSTGSAKKSRDNSDTDEAVSSTKRGSKHQSANGKAKRQTRLSHSKVSDDSSSNKSTSPLTVSSPAIKRRRLV